MPEEGAWVLIFPEGTRIPVGQMGKFSRGGTALAVNAGLPVLPIAHNAGQYWPKAGWAKYPGTIQVVIGPAMHAEGEGPRHRRAKPARRSLGQRDHGRDQPHPAAGQPSGAVGGLVKGRKAPARRTVRRFDKKPRHSGASYFTRGTKQGRLETIDRTDRRPLPTEAVPRRQEAWVQGANAGEQPGLGHTLVGHPWCPYPGYLAQNPGARPGFPMVGLPTRHTSGSTPPARCFR